LDKLGQDQFVRSGWARVRCTKEKTLILATSIHTKVVMGWRRGFRARAFIWVGMRFDMVVRKSKNPHFSSTPFLNERSRIEISK